MNDTLTNETECGPKGWAEQRQRLTAEFLGTGLLLATVVGSGIMGERLAGGNVAIALLANTMATGAGLVALILTFGSVSAHFNPAVSLLEGARGSLARPDVVLYVLAQVAGAFGGCDQHFLRNTPGRCARFRCGSAGRHGRRGAAVAMAFPGPDGVPANQQRSEHRKERRMSADPTRMLFVCTGNSCRSQMAEGLARTLGGDRVRAFSAGTQPKPVHPLAVQVMREIDVDISSQQSKDIETFAGEGFDFVITVCDRAKQDCPVVPGTHERIHWGFDDPADATGSEAERLRQFRRVRDEIRQRLRLFFLANGVAKAGRN